VSIFDNKLFLTSFEEILIKATLLARAIKYNQQWFSEEIYKASHHDLHFSASAMKFLTFILLIAFIALAVQALPEAEPNPEANPGPNPKADPKANPFFFPFFRFGREGGWEGGWGWGR
jgi:hypothetical protein